VLTEGSQHAGRSALLGLVAQKQSTTPPTEA
jgi:hypothetical protein